MREALRDCLVSLVFEGRDQVLKMMQRHTDIVQGMLSDLS